MPLRDHFHEPALERFHWEGFHSAWANTIVRQLNQQWLPSRYRAEPQIHLGSQVEVDVAAWDEEAHAGPRAAPADGAATAVWAPPQPTMTLQTDLDDPDLFEVKIFDEERQSRLVAAIELVSPGNKDRDAHRRDFVIKCASWLRAGVALIIVDIVTTRHENLFQALVELLKVVDVDESGQPNDLYAVALKPAALQKGWHVRAWPHLLRVGETLPTLPLWLTAQLAVPMDLEASYQETCGVLRVR